VSNDSRSDALKDVQAVLFQLRMERWDWNSEASNDKRRAAVRRLEAVERALQSSAAASASGTEPVARVIDRQGYMPRVEWYGAYPAKGTLLYAAPIPAATASEREQRAVDMAVLEDAKALADTSTIWVADVVPVGMARRVASALLDLLGDHHA
jgi:hypothetical protein